MTQVLDSVTVAVEVPSPVAAKSSFPSRMRNLDAAKVTDLILLPPADITIQDGHNPRKYSLAHNRAHLDSLKLQILANDCFIHTPLKVRYERATGTPIVVDGECRLRAALELMAEGQWNPDVKRIQCIDVTGSADTAAKRSLLALTSNTGQPLSKWEKGGEYVKLMDFGGFTLSEVAARVGEPERYVREAVELANAPDEVHTLIADGSVSEPLALQAIRAEESNPDAPAAVEALKAAATAAQGTGKPAKRVKVRRKSNGVSLCPELYAAIVALFEDFPTSDLDPIEVDGQVINDVISVNRVKLLNLASFLATPEDVSGDVSSAPAQEYDTPAADF